jgi:hypothetical protein
MEIAAALLTVGVVWLCVVAGRRVRWPRPDRSEAVRRLLRHIARRSIAELTEGGAAVVRGTAVATDEPLIAPVSGVPCIGYHLLVRDAAFDTIILDHARCHAFSIRDGTGTLRVDGDGLELAAIQAPQHDGPPLPPPIAALLPGHWRGVLVRWCEGVLLDGMSVAACGVVHLAPAAGELYREARHRVELVASSTFPLVASPDPDLAVPVDRTYHPEELRG